MTYRYQNIPIYYEIFGQGPVVVLLHGFLESSTMWKPLIPQLSKNNTVVTVDFPGHGKSGIIAKIHTMELMAEVVREILETLKLSSATFIGHSMGGYVALAYAEAYGNEIEKLILLNSTSAADSEERKEVRNRSIDIVGKVPKAYISMAIGNLFAESSLENFKPEIEALKEEAYTFPVEGIKAAIRGMRDRKDRTEILKNFKKEKYVIVGENDPILPVFELKKLMEGSDVPIKIIEGGHMSLIENFDSTSKYLLFID